VPRKSIAGRFLTDLVASNFKKLFEKKFDLKSKNHKLQIQKSIIKNQKIEKSKIKIQKSKNPKFQTFKFSKFQKAGEPERQHI
jgi:hypothetical protein